MVRLDGAAKLEEDKAYERVVTEMLLTEM